MRYTEKLMLNGEEYSFAAPEQGWQPGANTIAYYPLDSTNTVNDLSGNGYNLTANGTYQFGTYGGVDCCYISSDGYLEVSKSGSGNMTILAWCNYQGEPTNDTGVIAMTFSIHPVHQIGYNKKNDRPNYDSDGGIYAYAERGPLDYTTNYHENANQRYLAVGVRDGSSIKLYINGALEKEKAISEGTFSYNKLSVSRNTRSMVGYVSRVIFEDKVRTATEVQNYFDQTKSLYGIS